MHSSSGANRPFKDQQWLRILQWNAGGFSHEKRTQLMSILISQDIDVFIIVEANFNLSSYNGAEIIKLDVWKWKRHFKVYGCYSPPGNTKLDFSLLTFTSKTILCGDFNAHSKRCNYSDLNSAGKVMEDLLIADQMELLYNDSDIPTYLHYNGNGTNPDLTLASADIADDVEREVIYDPGSGHRVIITGIGFDTSNSSKRPFRNRWNFAKADWKNFTLENETIYFRIRFEFLGKQFNYKPFWNENLAALKEKSSTARFIAEQSKNSEDVQNWRKSVALLRKEILTAKRNCFNNFITKIYYRKDGKKVFNFVNKIQNRANTSSTEPLRVGNRVLTNDMDISNCFNLFYSTKKRLNESVKTRQKIIGREIRNIASSQSHGHEIFHRNFSISKLREAVGHKKCAKSPGPDNFHPEFLKHLGCNALSVLLTLYNHSWKYGVPAIWKKAIVVPIPKKNKPLDDLNTVIAPSH
ncbi:hypothetical protein TNCV_2422101 [Trichonephila clavipes]|nr:hypothetical protein TNCV_2422101 [Trichonephila clavipes]